MLLFGLQGVLGVWLTGALAELSHGSLSTDWLTLLLVESACFNRSSLGWLTGALVELSLFTLSTDWLTLLLVECSWWLNSGLGDWLTLSVAEGANLVNVWG